MEFKDMSIEQLANAGAINGRRKEYPVVKLAAAIRIAAACCVSDLLSEYISQEASIEEISDMLRHAENEMLMSLHEDNNTIK